MSLIRFATALCAVLAMASISVRADTEKSESRTPLPVQKPAVTAVAAGDKASETSSASRSAPSAPTYASAAEARMRASLLEQLAPLLAYSLPDAQVAIVKDALKLVEVGNLVDAEALEAQLTDPVARKLVTWKRLQRGGGRVPADAIARFLDANPLWPERERLRGFYEAALLRDGGSATRIRRYFTANEPLSGAGEAAWASAELALGNKDKAHELAAKAWCHGRLPAELEDDFFARFASILNEADHKCRLDRLLLSSPRSALIRRSRATAAERLLPRLSASERPKAEARIAVYSRSKGALRTLAAVVKQRAAIKDDWGLAFQRIERSRRARDYAHAYELLKDVPGDHPSLVNRDEWWEERERQARHWLAKGNIDRAYAIAAGVRPESPNPAKEQAFFAGWIALMQLGKPAEAKDHFRRMVASADGPLSKSMSEFWLARSYEKLGDKKQARVHYEESAKIRDTFHGLLSRRAAWPKSRRIELPPAVLPSPEERRRFLEQDAVKGLLAAIDAGMSRRDTLMFYRALGLGLESGGELALLAQLASAKGDGQGEVRIGKYGIARGFPLYEFAYPVHHLPEYDPLRPPVEPALVLAIGRQESEFNTAIVSHAGARGVLQVMPITARHICRQYKISCRLDDLLSDPSYNARIASAYIADRHDEFSGSYILTLTGFNAGPGRTRQWLRTMGDPRASNVVALDWIYRIPFEETRLYVRKVLANVQVYRARLGESDPLRLDLDLRRGQG